MIYEMTIKSEDKEDIEDAINGRKNKILIDELYNEIFRPIIKYGNDEELIKAYETVWEKLGPYLHGEDYL